MDVIATLQNWTEQWMNKRGGGDNWDWNHTNSTFSKYYSEYGVNIAPTQMSPYSVISTETKPLSAYTATYGPNDYESTVAFQHSYASTDQFSWTLSAGLSTTVSTKVSVGVPDVFSAEAGVSFTVQTSASTTQTTTQSTTWTNNTTFTLPARQQSTVTMVVKQDTVSANATMTAVVSGTVAAGLNSRYNGHYFWWVPVTDLAQQFNSDSGITVVGNTVVFSVPVSFSGQAGVGSYLQIKNVDASGQVVGDHTDSFISHPAARAVGRSPGE
ncbi:MAG TPA: ETX/MTX2 family pore-forming toxin [Longimicrobium sp.]